MAKIVTGDYLDFQKTLKSVGQQKIDNKKSTTLTNEELTARVKELEEKYSKLLEALPQIIKEELDEIGYPSKL